MEKFLKNFKKQFCYTLVILCLGIYKNTWAQQYWGIKYFGLSLHPKGDPNAPLMPLNPDKKGYLVFNLGGMVSYEQFWKPQKFSVKGIQAIYTDCAAQLGGFTHIGLRAIIFQNRRHSLNGGLGPTFIYRRNWYRLPDYQDSGFFNGTTQSFWQYKFIPYAGELEYNYQLTDTIDFSTTFVPGYPSLISLSFGLRFRLDKGFNKRVIEPETPISKIPY
ncbi:hypothetical protein AHMF7605_06185 [Adhaeribacter arboris]|uniref:Outer membrane protein beta-barrel domain-containing protein n=1 Tax=Adhaeribacter arboris TaxID=2072846 RepID=A0A2T2YCB2_9BACT|nr:hypothetical protein [Adhaeribacter arboris]PSR53147.1 hypothetical protein AHMF7605_06185 [Adhaeribacter arboris]